MSHQGVKLTLALGLHVNVVCPHVDTDLGAPLRELLPHGLHESVCGSQLPGVSILVTLFVPLFVAIPEAVALQNTQWKGRDEGDV